MVNPNGVKGSTLAALGVQRAIAEGWLAVEMVNTRQRDERSAAAIAAVWPDDEGADTFCGI